MEPQPRIEHPTPWQVQTFCGGPWSWKKRIYSYIVFGRHGCVSIITWGIESCLWHFGSRLSQTGLNILFFERSVHWGETQSVLSGVSDSELRGDSECRGVTSVLHPPLLPPSLWPIWVSMWQLSLRSPLWRLRHGWTSRPTSSSRWRSLRWPPLHG